MAVPLIVRCRYLQDSPHFFGHPLVYQTVMADPILLPHIKSDSNVISAPNGVSFIYYPLIRSRHESPDPKYDVRWDPSAYWHWQSFDSVDHLVETSYRYIEATAWLYSWAGESVPPSQVVLLNKDFYLGVPRQITPAERNYWFTD